MSQNTTASPITATVEHKQYVFAFGLSAPAEQATCAFAQTEATTKERSAAAAVVEATTPAKSGKHRQHFGLRQNINPSPITDTVEQKQ